MCKPTNKTKNGTNACRTFFVLIFIWVILDHILTPNWYITIIPGQICSPQRGYFGKYINLTYGLTFVMFWVTYMFWLQTSFEACRSENGMLKLEIIAIDVCRTENETLRILCHLSDAINWIAVLYINSFSLLSYLSP